MKRSSAEETNAPLKRRASSLFSIDTVQEDETNNSSSSEIADHDDGRRRQLLVPNDSSCCATDATAIITEDDTEQTEASCCFEEGGGLFIEEEEEEEGEHDDNDKGPNGELIVSSPFLAPSTRTTRDGAVMEYENRVGIVIEAATQHYDRSNKFHKERPARVESIVLALKENGLLERCCCRMMLSSSSAYSSTNNNSSKSSEKLLQDDDYFRVHLPGYMHRLNGLSKYKNCNCSCSCSGHDDDDDDNTDERRLDREAAQYKSIFLTSESGLAAQRAASALCRLVSQCVSSENDNNNNINNNIHKNGFAVIRPPGHHAEAGTAGGYCLINNVAVAAAHARAKYPDKIKKILIVDWDVHHGNGTQSIFYTNPDVFYFSVHRSNFFPFLKSGGPDFVGEADGAGFNVNIGWSNKGMGNAEYEAVWRLLLLPMVSEFDPDLVLISAGFDAADGDMGDCHVTPECFGSLTRQLKQQLVFVNNNNSNNKLAVAPIVAALEGGYVRSVLGKCVSAVVEALLEKDDNGYEVLPTLPHDADEILKSINPSAAQNIRQTIEAHRPYWKCLL